MIITKILLHPFLFFEATGVVFSIFPRLSICLSSGLQFVHDWCTERRWCIYSWAFLRFLCLRHHVVVVVLTLWYWQQFLGSEVSLRSSLGYSSCRWHLINWRLACWNLTDGCATEIVVIYCSLSHISHILHLTVYVQARSLAVRLWPLAVHRYINCCGCLRAEDRRQFKVHALVPARPVLLICVAIFQRLWTSWIHHFLILFLVL